MSEYNIEQQRQAALQTLQKKQEEIRSLVVLPKTSPKSVPVQRLTDSPSFDYYCQGIRNTKYYRTGQKAFAKANPKSIVAYALHYIQVEEMIERLKDGEDPRAILYEVVSNECL